MLKLESIEPGLVRLSGRFDASQVETAETRLEELGGPSRLDLSGLDYISSAGISVLLRHFKSVKANGQELVLLDAPSHVVDVLRYAGLDRIFSLRTS